jgi:hypothetical protein
MGQVEAKLRLAVNGATQAYDIGLQFVGFREESRDHGRSLVLLARRGKLASPRARVETWMPDVPPDRQFTLCTLPSGAGRPSMPDR